MSKRSVRRIVDLANPAELTPAQEAELNALDAMPDADIDTSDIPPLMDIFWKNAVRNPFYKPTQTSTTVRIDSDMPRTLSARCRRR